MLPVGERRRRDAGGGGEREREDGVEARRSEAPQHEPTLAPPPPLRIVSANDPDRSKIVAADDVEIVPGGDDGRCSPL